jgi:hypothetical protein
MGRQLQRAGQLIAEKHYLDFGCHRIDVILNGGTPRVMLLE